MGDTARGLRFYLSRGSMIEIETTWTVETANSNRFSVLFITEVKEQFILYRDTPLQNPKQTIGLFSEQRDISLEFKYLKNIRSSMVDDTARELWMILQGKHSFKVDDTAADYVDTGKWGWSQKKMRKKFKVISYFTNVKFINRGKGVSLLRQ